MKAYYEDSAVTIYHGDCREILPSLPKVDLVLTDPPYGIGEKWDKPGCFASAGGKLWNGDAGWDKSAPSKEVIELVLGMATDCIFWGGNYFHLPPSRGYFIWDKMQTGFSLADSEYAWVSKAITPRTFRYARAQLASEGKEHPTQKPLRLFSWCLSFFPEAQTILDPFMGSGTTLRAAKDLGRKAIGIELEEKYCEIAAKRMAQEVLL